MKRQLRQLHSGALPEYSRRLRRAEAVHKERKRVNAVVRDLEMDMAEKDFILEKKAAAREFEDHKVRGIYIVLVLYTYTRFTCTLKSEITLRKLFPDDFFLIQVFLREQLISELEDKQKMIEGERHGMELTGDSTELKTVSTRKLRRRANEPSSE